MDSLSGSTAKVHSKYWGSPLLERLKCKSASDYELFDKKEFFDRK
ncbi:hypothetical protein [Paenibacillus sp. TH7-28]